MISKNVNLKLTFRVENLIFLAVLFVTIFLQLFAFKKSTFKNSIISTANSFSA